MKKLFNLLLLLLCLATAFPASAKDFLLMVDGTSGLTVREKTSSISYFMVGGDITINEGLQTISVSQNYFDVKGANSVYVNGTKITQTNSSFVNFDTSNYAEGSLIEIYTSSHPYSEANRYTYPLTLSINDPDGQIDSFTNDTKNESVYSDIESGSTTFRYGDTFTMRTSSAATSCTLNGSNVEQGGSSGSYSYTFTPTPALTAPTFAIEVHEVVSYNVKLQTDDYTKITSVTKNGASVTTPTGSVTTYSGCSAGDVFVVTTSEAAYSATYNATELTRSGSGAYTFTVAASQTQTCYIQFAEQVTVDPNAKFTVTLNVDRADAVQYSVNGGPTIVLPVGNTSIEAPEEGFIRVSLTDKGRYAFTKFEDTNQSDSEKKNFMDYDNQQTTDVILRKTRRTGESEGFEIDGHTFRIETLDNNLLSGYYINIDVVDDATYVMAKVGASQDTTSANNRTISLATGSTRVKILSTDQYLLIKGSDIQHTVYSVSVDGTDWNHDGSINKLYIISLSDALEDKTVTITANTPAVVSETNFSAVITGYENITNIKYWIDNDMWEQVDCTSQFAEGDNSVMFNAGDSYHIYYNQGAVVSVCTLSGQAPAVDSDSGATFVHDASIRRIDFTPSDGDELILTFAAPQAKPKFTLKTDTPENMLYIYNTDTGDEIYDADSGATFGNANGELEIEFNIDNGIYIIFRGEPEIFKNGQSYSFSSGTSFYPENGDVLFLKYKEDLTYEQNDHMQVVINGELYDDTYVSLAWTNGENTGFFAVNEETRVDNITFNAQHEGQMTLRVFDFPNGTVHAYLNGDKLDGSGTGSGTDPFVFSLQGVNNGIIRLYFTKDTPEASAPETHEVHIFASDSNNTGASASSLLEGFTFTREDIQTLELNQKENIFHELMGTFLKISRTDGQVFTVVIADSNGNPLHDAAYQTSSPRRVRYNSDADVDGNNPIGDSISKGEVTIIVDRPMHISVEKGTVTGIEAVSAEAEGELAPVYNLQGIVVKQHSTEADLHTLPAGIYLVNGHKVVVK